MRGILLGWTITDEDQLRKLAATKKTADEIAAALKRSVSAVRNRARKLKIPLGKK